MAASGEQEKDGVSEAAASILSGLPDGSKSLLISTSQFFMLLGREGTLTHISAFNTATVTAQQLFGDSGAMKALSERLAAQINSSLIPVERYVVDRSFVLSVYCTYTYTLHPSIDGTVSHE